MFTAGAAMTAVVCVCIAATASGDKHGRCVGFAIDNGHVYRVFESGRVERTQPIAQSDYDEAAETEKQLKAAAENGEQPQLGLGDVLRLSFGGGLPSDAKSVRWEPLLACTNEEAAK